jgi:N-acetyl-anhydromuramyl-L-alanine amidase AmpD
VAGSVLASGGEWSPLADVINHRPSPNYGYGSLKPNWRAVTWHIADGGLEGTLDWLTSQASQSSAHVVIGRNAEIYSLVPLTKPAWCQGNVCSADIRNPIIAQTTHSGLNPNLVSYSIECVGYSKHGRPGALTDVQAAALVRVTAYLCYRSRLTADRTHILGHCQWDGCTRSECPGYSLGEWSAWVEAVRQLCLLWRGW